MPTTPSRIDFSQNPDGTTVIIKFWRTDGKDQSPGGGEKKASDFDYEGALAWCRRNGYTVHEWYNGARAWLGLPWIIRNRKQIQVKRAQVEKTVRTMLRLETTPEGVNILAHDLAYDL